MKQWAAHNSAGKTKGDSRDFKRPRVRPSKVKMGKKLISLKDYPDKKTLDRLATVLAGKFIEEGSVGIKNVTFGQN